MKALARTVIPLLDKLAIGLATEEADLSRACTSLSVALTRYAGPEDGPPIPPG